jgi:hypothetical protein
LPEIPLKIRFLLIFVLFVAVCAVGLTGLRQYAPIPPTRIVIGFDQYWQSNVPDLVAQLRKTRFPLAVEILQIDVGVNSTDEDASVGKILEWRPALVITTNANVLAALRAAEGSAKGVYLAGNPWGERNAAGQWRDQSGIDAWISTHSETELQCLGWLSRLDPGAKKIGLMAWTGANNAYVEKFAMRMGQTGYAMQVLRSRNPEDTIAHIKKSRELGIDAWYLPHSPAVWRDAHLIAAAARTARVKTLFDYSHYYAKSGGLLSCAVQFDSFERTAETARLLLTDKYAGVKFEFRPSFLSIGLNTDTARAIGMKLDRETLRRVDLRFHDPQSSEQVAYPLAEGQNRKGGSTKK